VLRQSDFRAIPIYSDVLEIDPDNTTALRNRGMSYRAMVAGKRDVPLNPEALADAKRYCEREPKSFEAPMCAAVIFAEAAKKDPQYKKRAADYLGEALAKGMPKDWVRSYALDSLICKDNQELFDRARSKEPNEQFQPRPANDPPATPDWEAFEKEFGNLPTEKTRR
jgi:hypothetical protein